MSHMYSITTKGFYPVSTDEQLPYIAAGTLPGDLKEISDDDYNNFFNPPDGYWGVFDDSGPHLELLTTAAETSLSTARSEYDRASDKIDALEDQIEDEDYTDTDTEEVVKAARATWTNYRKLLRAYIKAADGTATLPTAPDA